MTHRAYIFIFFGAIISARISYTVTFVLAYSDIALHSTIFQSVYYSFDFFEILITMAEGMDESIPSYVMEALLDSFSESDSDVGDISGDFSGNVNDESQPDLLGSYSDVASDDDSTV